MVDLKTFREIAMAFPAVTEQPHFEKRSFWVNKKIFATLDEKNKRAVLKLSETDQSVFCAFDKSIIYPVPGKWGIHGWTMIELSKVRKTMLKDAMTVSYHTVAPKKKAQ
jgi:predicted DNA-binding protein (MmcQ/YjbR family)